MARLPDGYAFGRLDDCSMSSDPMIQCACQSEHFLKELGLHGFAVFLDEIRALSKAAADVHERMANIGSALTIVLPPDVSAIQQYQSDLEAALKYTCGSCCHYQTHPPRCRLSKRRISPKQFTCKKYSPKYNSLK